MTTRSMEPETVADWPWPLRHAANAWVSLRHFREWRLKRVTGGLLPVEVYRALSVRVRRAPPGLDIIEVGGASGTATIAMASGLRPSGGHYPRVIVVEKCEGGSRSPYGGWEANKARFDRFVRRYGMQDRVVLFPHYLTPERGGEVRALVRTERLAGLLADADGMVHRDMHLFGDLIDRRGFVAIDDYHPSRSAKHAVTFAVVNRLIEAGALRPLERIRDTLICGPGSDVSEALFHQCDGIARAECERYGVLIDERGITPSGGRGVLGAGQVARSM